MHVDDIKGTATRQNADSGLAYLNSKVGNCKADYGSFPHTGIQHEHSPWEVYIHQCACIDGITPIVVRLLIGKDEEAQCDQILHEAYRSVLGVVAWTVLTRAEFAFMSKHCKDVPTHRGLKIVKR